MERTLYVFGDAKTIPNFGVESHESFWGLAAQELGTSHVYNFSFVNNCLDNIIHLFLNHEFNYDNGYFLICIPPLVSYSVYDPSKTPTTGQRVYGFNKDFEPIAVTSTVLAGVTGINFTEAFSNDLNYITFFRAEWYQVLMLEKIYLLTSWLQSKNAKFIIANISKPFDLQEYWPTARPIMLKVKECKNCIIFENTYYSVNQQDNIQPPDFDIYEWNGHHSSEGNSNWYAKVIKPKMQELRWIR